MNDSKDDNKNDAGGKKTLTLKGAGVGQGTVRQDMGRGRSKSVVVETRKRRISRPDEDKAAPTISLKPRKEVQKPAPAKAPAAEKEAAPRKPAQENVNRLSASEMEARRKALEGSRVREVEDRKRAEEDAIKRAEQEKVRAKEAEELARKQAEEDLRIQKEAEEKKRAEELARKKSSGRPPEEAAPAARRKDGPAESTPSKAAPRGGKPTRPEAPKPTRNPRGQDDRRRGKLTLTAALNDDGSGGRSRSLAAHRRRQEKIRRAQMEPEVREKIAREVTLPETITIQELSQRMAERSVDVIKYLMKEGQMMKPDK
mmetsp:Transcript_21718/g.28556  ORF Transcript_21718/g.28556 Transcript_21718/m.28556 type:complete len:314 (-) Transcript_21718:7-948(-)